MTNYVLLYVGGTYPESEAEMQEVMGAWGAWYGKMGAAVVDGGNPFNAAMSVTADGVVDGSVAEPQATGYTVISAESMEAATAAASDHPHIRFGGKVIVHQTFQM